MQTHLLDNPYLLDISNNRIIPEWTPDQVRLLLNSYYNKYLSMIFITLEKQFFMVKLMNQYKLTETQGKESEFVNSLFVYYNLFIETYKDTTRCRGNITEPDFQSNWYSIINCMNVTQMAQLIVYIDVMNESDKSADDDDEMDVDGESDAVDALVGLKRKQNGRDETVDDDEMDVATALTGLKDSSNE